MPTIELVRRSPIVNTFRVAKVQGMFDLPAHSESEFRIRVDMPIEDKPWKLGLITGASGTGKSTVARDRFTMVNHHSWEAPSLVDDFPAHMTPTEITNLLVSVGLSSSPAWLRPYRVLSTGQQFRADLARTLAEQDDGQPVAIDEFTSTVDRTVAKSVSVALAKHVRRNPNPLVLVSCHKDIIEWLQPDWVCDLDRAEFTWGTVQPRPRVTLAIREGTSQAWPLFRGHHYLSGDLSPAARVFLGYVQLGDDDERLAGFFSILPVMGHTGWRRGHRTVILPDFQGLGIGNRLIETVAEQLWQRERIRFRATTSAPGLVQHRLRRPEMWRLAQAPAMKANTSTKGKLRGKTSAGRLTTSWVYIPEDKRLNHADAG